MKCLQWKSDFHWILRTEHRYPRTELFPLGALDFYTKKNMGLRLKDGFVRSVEEYPKFQCRIIFNIKSSPCLVPFLFKPSWFARQYSDPNQTRSTLSGRIASNSRQQYWPVRRFAQLPFLLQMREALYYRTQLLKRIATHKAKSEVSHWKIMRLGVHAGRVRPVVFARAGRPQTFAARFVPQGASPNRPLPVSSLWVHWDPESFFDIFCPTSILNHLGNDLGAIFSPSKTMGSAEVIRETIEMVCRTDSMADGRPRLQSWGIPVTIGY